MRSSWLWSGLCLIIVAACGTTEGTRRSPTPVDESQSLMSPDGFHATAWVLSLDREGYKDEALWVDEDQLYIQTSDAEGYCVVHAVALATGVPKWMVRLPEKPLYAPGISADRVAFVCGSKAVVVDRTTGVRTSPGPAYHLDFWASSPPAVTSDSLFVGSFIHRRLESISLASGFNGWHFGLEDLVTIAPVVAGSSADKALVVAAESGEVVGLPLRSADAPPPRDVLWTRTTGTNDVDCAARGDIVYLASGDTFLYALNGLTGTVIWKCAAGAPFEGYLDLAGDLLLARTKNEFLAVDANTGEIRWRAPQLDRFVVALPGRVVCTTASGSLSVRDASDGHERVCLSSPILEHVAVNHASDLLVFGDGAGQITALR
ncbi:MAG: PQQ-binding-like beta-propeller repeat protein [Planctomycetota bacterium]